MARAKDHRKDDDLGKARALALTPVSRETEARLDRFVELLLTWQRTINLIAPSTIPDLWVRHVADSLQLLPLAPGAREWIDLGSGGGFPGMALACALAARPGSQVHLVESNTRKAAFLREAVRATGAAAVVHGERIEDFAARWQEGADAVTARGLAPLPVLLAWIEPFQKKGAQALLLKGQDVELELTRAAKCWNIEAELVPSKTHRSGRIVIVRALARRNPAVGEGLDHVERR